MCAGGVKWGEKGQYEKRRDRMAAEKVELSAASCLLTNKVM